ISLILKGALVAGATGDAVGVHFDGGADNSLLNYASLLTLEGVDGMALLGGTGSEQVDNYGTVIGNFDLGGGANAFYNHEDSWLFPGATAFLGSGNLLTNAGFLSPGGLDRVQTTSLIGDFLQTETGFYIADLDFNGNVADRLDASGEAVVDGQIDLNTLHPENLLPGSHDVVIISGEDGLVDVGTELSVAPSAVVGYQLTMPDTNSLAVGLDVDFSPEGLTGNLERIGDYFNRIQLAGGSAEMGPVIADLFGQPDLPSLVTTYDYMNPDYYDHFTQTELDVTRQLNRMVLRRMQAVRRDDQTSPSLSGTRRAVGRDERVHLAFAGSDQQVAGLFDRSSTKRDYGVWLNISRLNSDQQGTEEFDGFDAESRVLAAGVDRRFGDQGLAGLSFGYSRATLDLDDHVSDGRIEGFHLSLYGGYDTEDLYVDGILSYGRQDYDNDRLTRVLGDYRLATSDHDGNTLSLFGEVGRHLKMENWLVQPYLSLNYIYLDEGSFSEEGAEMLSLNVKRRSTQSLFCDAGIRFTGLFETVAGVVSPGISLGLSHDFGLDDRTVRAGFAGYPGASFSVEGREPERVGFLGGLSLSVRGEGGVSAALKYQHEVRHDFKAREILAEIRVAF
ncbi:MAG: hypothetical protein C0614_11440, partial [Desulfuromonas sp.]